MYEHVLCLDNQLLSEWIHVWTCIVSGQPASVRVNPCMNMYCVWTISFCQSESMYEHVLCLDNQLLSEWIHVWTCIVSGQSASVRVNPCMNMYCVWTISFCQSESMYEHVLCLDNQLLSEWIHVWTCIVSGQSAAYKTHMVQKCVNAYFQSMTPLFIAMVYIWFVCPYIQSRGTGGAKMSANADLITVGTYVQQQKQLISCMAIWGWRMAEGLQWSDWAYFPLHLCSHPYL